MNSTLFFCLCIGYMGSLQDTWEVGWSGSRLPETGMLAISEGCYLQQCSGCPSSFARDSSWVLGVTVIHIHCRISVLLTSQLSRGRVWPSSWNTFYIHWF